MLKQVIEVMELIDDASVSGDKVKAFFAERGLGDVSTLTVKGEQGSTDFIKILVRGREGKAVGGDALTLGVIGRLGGLGVRPEMIGMVSDADGAATALAVALKLADMRVKGDVLDGDVIISTHICPNAPTEPHDPVPSWVLLWTCKP